MSIIDKSYFQKANLLNIPLSVTAPVANPTLATPDSTDYLDEVSGRVEKSILLNAFGLAMYNELQLALADIDNPLYASYKKLMQGDEYDTKVWKGLNNDYSLLAFRIYDVFLTETNERLTATGAVQARTEGANLVTSLARIVNANQEFYKGYQGNQYHFHTFYDFEECHTDLEVSLYQYMVDKETDFPLFDIGKFKIYNPLNAKNSLGL